MRSMQGCGGRACRVVIGNGTAVTIAAAPPATRTPPHPSYPLSYPPQMAKHIMTNSIKDQIQAFQDGFWEVVPRELVSVFNEGELELLISGLPDIDIDDLRANTEYSGFSAATPVIQWFWEILRVMDREDRARLVQFVTGTSKVREDVAA